MGTGRMKYVNGDVYDGEWRDGHWHGKGTLSTVVGVYVGEFSRGKRNGYGEMKFADNSQLKSMWRDDRACGVNSSWVTPNSYVLRYEGDLDNSEKHGRGVENMSDLSLFEGNFFHGKVPASLFLTFFSFCPALSL